MKKAALDIFCYQHHIHHWRRETHHLSFEEKGVLLELIDAFFLTNGRLLNDRNHLFRIIGAQTLREKKTINKIVAEFFEVRGEFLFEPRAEKGLAYIQEKSAKASGSAYARWRKNKDVDYANVECLHSNRSGGRFANYQPQTINTETSNKDKGLMTAISYADTKIWKNAIPNNVAFSFRSWLQRTEGTIIEGFFEHRISPTHLGATSGQRSNLTPSESP